jgi:hypothetical protein
MKPLILTDILTFARKPRLDRSQEIITVCIYWYPEEIAERFSYPRKRPINLYRHLNQIHKRKVNLIRPCTQTVRYYTDNYQPHPIFKVTIIN